MLGLHKWDSYGVGSRALMDVSLPLATGPIAPPTCLEPRVELLHDLKPRHRALWELEPDVRLLWDLKVRVNKHG